MSILDCLGRLSIAMGWTGKRDSKGVLVRLGNDYQFIVGYNQLYLIHYRDLPHISQVLSDINTVLTAKDSILSLIQQ